MVSAAGTPLARLEQVLSGFPGVTIGRLFASAGEQQLADARRDAVRSSGRSQPDLSQYLRFRVPAGLDADALIARLKGLDAVESAAPAPRPVPPPATPSFTGSQGYRTAAASGGVDADYAQGLTGGKGENVRIVDVEYNWNRLHEDLSKARAAGSTLTNGVPCDPFASNDHGTAVLGELVGDANGIGVTGLAPSASVSTVNAATDDAGSCDWNVASAITVAADNTVPGDVILIEQQTVGPNATDPSSQNGLVPVEWWQPARDAILDATSRGRIVVEAAGNGAENLDAPVYDDATGVNWFSHDSGAIVVGAGNAPGCTGFGPEPARGRLAFSNYGSRLDVQGWGSCVTTTGYGDLQGGGNASLWYTAQFAGTSSASPIVAACAAVVSGVARSRATTLTPVGVRSILKSTGQAQTFGAGGSIGPLPNLRAAIAIIPSTVTGAASTVTATTAALAATVNPSGVQTAYRFEYGTTTGYGSQTSPVAAGAGTAAVPASAQLTGLSPLTTYHFRIVATRSGQAIATGADHTFTTAAGPPAAVTGDASDIAQTTSSLNGQVDPRGAPTAWRFDYGTTTAYGSQTPQVNAGAGSGAIPVSAHLTGLAPQTTYHFRIVAVRNGQAAATGADRTFATSATPVVPPVVPIVPAIPPVPVAGPAPQNSVAGVSFAGVTPPTLSPRGAKSRATSALASKYGRRWRTRRHATLRCTETLNDYGVAIGDDYTCAVTWDSGARRFTGGAHVWVDGDKVRLTLKVRATSHARSRRR